MFQSTRPRGARRFDGVERGWRVIVSIHAPAWGATRPFRSRGPIRGRFNPRARVGRDLDPRLCRRLTIVSIHAPAWGATNFDADVAALDKVSFHAPAWGATLPVTPSSFSFSTRFNPRARVGRDKSVRTSKTLLLRFQSTRPRGARRLADRDAAPDGAVSIHAPAWGATSAFTASSLSASFQSTRPRGARRAGIGEAVNRYRFNPRARVGRDCKTSVGMPNTLSFQSTRPRGARLSSSLSSWRRMCVSIHAPAWGATILDCLVGQRADVSIHAPAWGATPTLTRWATTSTCFNPRARVGRDLVRSALLAAAHCFNPRARVGRDSAHRPACCRSESFNPRARVGRDGRGASPSLVYAVFQSTRPRGARQLPRLELTSGAAVSIHAPAWGATYFGKL